MKRLMAKIWVPTLLVMVAAVQSFGIDAARAVSYRKQLDSLTLSRLDDSIVATPVAVDSFEMLPVSDSTMVLDTIPSDSLTTVPDTLILSARDTIKVPEELRALSNTHCAEIRVHSPTDEKPVHLQTCPTTA